MAGTVKEEAIKLRKNIDGVYDAGKQAEYDRFWNSFQLNGTRTNYVQAFSGVCWRDDTLQPKYPIIAKTANDMFAYNSGVTKIEQDIIINATTTLYRVFSGCSNLTEISSLAVNENVGYSAWFSSCGKLTTIHFTPDSVIGNDISFSPCPLSYDSLLNIISVLKDFRTTQSYDCSFKSFQEEYLVGATDFTEAFPSFAYGKFFEFSYDKSIGNVVFINFNDNDNDGTPGISFDNDLPAEIADATHIAFDESGESITLKFATTTATRTLTLSATSLGYLSEDEKSEAEKKGWTVK